MGRKRTRGNRVVKDYCDLKVKCNESKCETQYDNDATAQQIEPRHNCIPVSWGRDKDSGDQERDACLLGLGPFTQTLAVPICISCMAGRRPLSDLGCTFWVICTCVAYY